MKKKVYLAGDMLSHGAQRQRAYERDVLLDNGVDVYNPADNKDINDKLGTSHDKLAERIVAADSAAMMDCDVAVVDYLRNAEGTICEIGMFLGYKQLAEQLLEMIMCGGTESDVVAELRRNIDRKVIVHSTDVRFNHRLAEEPWNRTSFGNNAFVYGAALALGNERIHNNFESVVDEVMGAA